MEVFKMILDAGIIVADISIVALLLKLLRNEERDSGTEERK